MISTTKIENIMNKKSNAIPFFMDIGEEGINQYIENQTRKNEQENENIIRKIDSNYLINKNLDKPSAERILQWIIQLKKLSIFDIIYKDPFIDDFPELKENEYLPKDQPLNKVYELLAMRKSTSLEGIGFVKNPETWKLWNQISQLKREYFRLKWKTYISRYFVEIEKDIDHYKNLFSTKLNIEYEELNKLKFIFNRISPEPHRHWIRKQFLKGNSIKSSINVF